MKGYIKIYGVSDDLIELEGDIYDEIGCWDSEVLLTFDTGLKIKWIYDGDWHAEVFDDGNSLIEFRGLGADNGYSDLIIIDRYDKIPEMKVEIIR